MKIQSRNLVYRQATAGCFICNKSRFGSILNKPQLFIRCKDYESKCPISNLYNDKIFKL
jgi:hypothetical protein